MGRLNLLNLSVLKVEVLQFLLKVLKVGVLFTETLEVVLGFLDPEPRVGGEAFEELADAILGALNGTSEEKDDLDDLLVLGNPVVEGLFLLFGDVLLEPELHLLGGLEHVGGGTVNGRLHLVEGGLQNRVVAVKTHVYLEERL